MKYYLNDRENKIRKKLPITLEMAIDIIDKLSTEKEYAGNFLGLVNDSNNLIQFTKIETNELIIDIPPFVNEVITLKEATNIIKDFFNSVDVVEKIKKGKNKNKKSIAATKTKKNSLLIIIWGLLLAITLCPIILLLLYSYIKITKNIIGSTPPNQILMGLLIFIIPCLIISWIIIINPTFIRPIKMKKIAERYNLQYIKEQEDDSSIKYNIISGTYNKKLIEICDYILKNVVDENQPLTYIKIGSHSINYHRIFRPFLARCPVRQIKKIMKKA
ncbi:MAG: hypothetical protein WC508_04425 [Patescibacteria group bacterium]